MGFTKATAAAAFKDKDAMTKVFEGKANLIGKVTRFVSQMQDDDPRLRDEALVMDDSLPEHILAYLLECWEEANR